MAIDPKKLETSDNLISRSANGRNLVFGKLLRGHILDAYNVGRAEKAAGEAYPIDWWDQSCPGLLIRIQRTKSAWYFRDNRCKPTPIMVNICDVKSGDWEKGRADEIRKWAAMARVMVGQNDDAGAIKKYLQDKGRGGEIIRHYDKEKDGWTWPEARDAWLKDIASFRAPGTVEDYTKVLNNDVFAPWIECDTHGDKLLKHITSEDVMAIQDAKYNAGNGRAAEKTLGNLKTCLKWCTQRADSGIKVSPAAGIEPREYVSTVTGDDEDDGGRVPTLDELGDLPWLLDRAPRVNPAKRLAAMLIYLTAQRRYTAATARRKDFKADGAGGGIWTVPSQYVKAGRKRDGRPHVIPLRPLAWHVVQLAMTLGSADDLWLFPQQRLRKAGDPGDKHMARESAYRAMEAAKSRIRPHDIRRAFATFGESLLGQPIEAISIILDHAEGRQDGAAERAVAFNALKAAKAAYEMLKERKGKHESPKEVKAVIDSKEGRVGTTANVYALHDAMNVKMPLMTAWEGWLLDLIAERAPEGAGPLPGFLHGFVLPAAE